MTHIAMEKMDYTPVLMPFKSLDDLVTYLNVFTILCNLMFCHLLSNLTNTFFILVNNFSIMSVLFPVFSGLDQYIKADTQMLYKICG